MNIFDLRAQIKIRKQEELAYEKAMKELTDLNRLVSHNLMAIPDDKKSFRRAYVAGACSALVMITLYAEQGFPEIYNAHFWPFFLLEEYQIASSKLGLHELITVIEDLSNKAFVIRPEDFVEPSLRIGPSGIYFSKGMSAVCMSYISNHLHVRPTGRFEKTMAWVNSKYEWLLKIPV